MTRCDALIVGGGPAGSTCAERLGRSGLDVLILDRKSFPRDKTCAGWVTPQVMSTLEVDLGDYADGRTLQPITGFLTGLIGRETVENHYDGPVSYGIRRCEFDHYLLQRCGAATRLGVPLKSMERTQDGWVVNEEIQAPLVIGAGGHFCPVARKLGARSLERASVVAAQEIEFEASAADLELGTARPEIPELYFCPDLKGYGWCFRKERFLNIGLGRVDSQNLSDHVAEFCEFLKDRGTIGCEIPVRFHGHAYQLYERVEPRLVDEGVLLIGDAAGLAYPQSGEGIRPAVESGILAAETIVRANGDYAEQRLKPYARLVRERFGKPRSNAASGWLPASWLQLIASRLLVNRSFARKVVIDRWFLHTQQPQLQA